MPDDELVDYLATQAIADYLATVLRLDGVIYPSAQGGDGRFNVALFNHAAAVAPLDYPEGTEVDVGLHRVTHDGAEIDYSIWVNVPAKPVLPPPPLSPLVALLDPATWDPGLPKKREPTLKVDSSNLTVHHVAAVVVQADSHDITFHRVEKTGTSGTIF